MDTTVIVALPRVDDRVTKVSSEVAHLTLCFLGETSKIQNLEEIVTFVQHAASQLSPFGLSVDYRGELGPDNADVLFFKKDSWSFPRINSFRGHLLQDNNIQKAYQSVDQYPEWTPHLTLGFPATPAHEDGVEHGFHYVDFDRIAIWTSNDSGPEFRLKDMEDSMVEAGMSAAWSDMSTAEKGEAAVAELFHFGKKGMKWGVRNEEKKAAKAAKKLDKADQKWEKSIYTTKGAIETHNAMADHFNSRIGAINDKHPNANLWDHPDSPESKAYMTEVTKLQNESYAAAVKSVHGTSPSGKKKAEFISDENGDRIEVRDVAVAHAADTEESDLTFLIKRDGNHIGELNFADMKLAHADEQASWLAHYGVKGMRWGVTTKDRAAQKTAAMEVQVNQTKPGKFAKTTGGKNLPLHPDAKDALVARQKAKGSTTDALSNAELRSAVQRMQLEQQFNNLEFSGDRRSRGARFIAGLFGSPKYGGKLKFEDMDEKTGGQVRDALKKAAAEHAKANAPAA